jgi:hypothetical protein
MSGAGFHVHGPHDHELEHATHHAASHGSESGMINQIAMFTAIIATVGAVFSYMGGATQANAGLYKNKQVSIALAAIALLTKKKWLEWGMFGVAGIGAAIGVLAQLHI